MQILEKNNYDQVRCEVESVVTTVEIGVNGGFSASMDSVVIPEVEFVIRSANAFSTGDPSNVVFDRTSDVTGNTQSLHNTTSSKLKPNRFK